MATVVLHIHLSVTFITCLGFAHKTIMYLYSITGHSTAIKVASYTKYKYQS